MTTSLLYCPTCGAANAPEDQVCFACQQPLALHIAGQKQASLVHNRYQVLKQVGMGGFGAVYKAQDTGDQNRLVAIKQINLRGLSPQEIIDATDGFNREVQIMSKLSHPHLPRFHTQFTDPEHWYVVMDFIEGETLEAYLRDITSAQENAIRALALDEVLDIGLQLCDVLAYLHTRQPPIVFRDLKPSNLLRAAGGRLYLIDFGIARYFKPGQSRDTSPLGSPGYAAPEQYGRAQTDGRADIYSLGALLHHLLARRDPSENPFTFAPLNPGTSAGQSELNALVTRMVATDVDQRPANITEVQSALQRIRDQRASSEPRIWRPAPGQTPPPPGSFRPVQVQQQVMARTAPRQAAGRAAASQKKSRRKFLKAGLSVGGSLALASTLGGFGYWKYWHPSRLALATGFPKQLLQPGADVSTINWSADGSTVFFGLSDGDVLGYRRETANIFTNFFHQATNQSGQPIKTLACSPDLARIVVIPFTGKASLWDARSQEELTFKNSPDNLQTVAWSPSSQSFAGLDNQGKLKIYDGQTGKDGFFNWEGSGTNALAWSPDGSRIATGPAWPSNMPNTLQIWDSSAGQSMINIPIGSTVLAALAWAPDGQSIAALGIDGTLQVWNNLNYADPSNYRTVFSQQINTQQNQLAWSPDSHFLAAIDDSNNLLILDHANGSTITSAPIVDSSGRGSTFPGQALTWLDSQNIIVASNQMECWLWSLNWF